MDQEPLTVLSVAFPFAHAGASAVGGAEHILGVLDRALIQAGHRSLVVAAEGSNAAGTLFATAALPELVDDAVRVWFRAQVQKSIDCVLERNNVDLIHMHGLDFHEYRLPADKPVLVTLHMPLDWYPADSWNDSGLNLYFQCVSQSQRQRGPVHLRQVPVIENGVAIPEFKRRTPADFALVLGRVCPEKNFHEAVLAGTSARTPVLIGGQLFPYESHLRYFKEKLEPALNASHSDVRHGFLGPLSSLRKGELLSRAKCLLHPTLAPETSSLVAMEALAHGVPVIAFRSGALPGIVEHGVTGWLVDGVEEMADAIGHVGEISSEMCRRTAILRFSERRMVAQYFSLYRNVCAGKRARVHYA